jgi:hypothetical protein
VYSRIIDGEEYTFGVSGKLIMNVLVMYDRQTDTLWSQLLGEAVDGPLKGTKLEFVPSWQTTWADWKDQHPDTIALEKGYRGSRDPYTGYYNSSSSGVIGQSTIDDRLYVKEFVVGVEQDGEAVAYPFGVLNDEPVVNDKVGVQPVLVVFNAETGTGVVFDRRVNDQILTFSLIDGVTLKDSETGTLWDGLTGQALDGELAGETLTRLKSTASFWFGWKDWYPDTRVYGIEE